MSTTSTGKSDDNLPFQDRIAIPSTMITICTDTYPEADDELDQVSTAQSMQSFFRRETYTDEGTQWESGTDDTDCHSETSLETSLFNQAFSLCELPPEIREPILSSDSKATTEVVNNVFPPPQLVAASRDCISLPPTSSIPIRPVTQCPAFCAPLQRLGRSPLLGLGRGGGGPPPTILKPSVPFHMYTPAPTIAASKM